MCRMRMATLWSFQVPRLQGFQIPRFPGCELFMSWLLVFAFLSLRFSGFQVLLLLAPYGDVTGPPLRVASYDYNFAGVFTSDYDIG